MSSKKKVGKDKLEKKEKKRSVHERPSSKKLNTSSFDDVDNALKRLPIWAHQTLEETDDPFFDEFADDITAPTK